MDIIRTLISGYTLCSIKEVFESIIKCEVYLANKRKCVIKKF